MSIRVSTVYPDLLSLQVRDLSYLQEQVGSNAKALAQHAFNMSATY